MGLTELPRLYRVPLPLTAMVLILANLITIAGVLIWDWNILTLYMVYFMENISIGVFYVFRLLAIAPVRGIPVVFLFLLHFSAYMGLLFWLGSQFDPVGLEDIPAAELTPQQEKFFGYTLFAFLASHAFSFAYNFIGKKEYVGLKLLPESLRIYKRIFFMNVVVIAGIYVAVQLGSPVSLLVGIIALKTALDVRAHVREHAPAGQ